MRGGIAEVLRGVSAWPRRSARRLCDRHARLHVASPCLPGLVSVSTPAEHGSPRERGWIERRVQDALRRRQSFRPTTYSWSSSPRRFHPPAPCLTAMKEPMAAIRRLIPAKSFVRPTTAYPRYDGEAPPQRRAFVGPMPRRWRQRPTRRLSVQFPRLRWRPANRKSSSRSTTSKMSAGPAACTASRLRRRNCGDGRVVKLQVSDCGADDGACVASATSVGGTPPDNQGDE